MHYDLLIFDLDGTLVDSAPDLQHAVNQVLAEQGAEPLPLNDIRKMIGDGAEHDGIPEADVPQALGDGRGVEGHDVDARCLHFGDRVRRIVVEAQFHHRRYQPGGIHEGNAVGAQHMLPAHALGRLETQQDVGGSRRHLG